MTEELNNNKRIAKNTLFLYCRSILLMLINLYTSRIVLLALGVDDYGIYNVVGGVVSLFSILSGTLASASQRFITYALGEKDADNLKKVFSNSLTLHIVLGIIIIVLLEILGVWMLYNQLNIPESRLDVANIVLQCSILTLFFGMLSVPYNALIIAHERMSAFAYISILEGVLKLCIAVFLLHSDYDKLILFAILHLAVSVLLRLVYSMYSRRNFVEARKISLRIDHQLFKQMFGFAGWNLLGQGSMVLRNQGIDILLNIFFGVSINAAKGISNQVQHVVSQFAGNFSTSIQPQLTMSIAQKDTKRTHSLIFHGSRLYFFMMMMFTVPLMNVATELLDIWLVEVPSYAVNMVILSLIYIQSSTLSKLLVNSILAHGNIKRFQIWAGGTKIMALPVAYFVLKLGGSPLTGIWINIVFVFCCRGVELYFTHRLLNYNALKNVLTVEIPCWFTFICALGISYLSYQHISNNLFVAGSISFFTSLAMIWGVGMNRHERNYVIKQTKTLLSHKILK